MAIQAVIMAGGEGVRLRPLTLDKPKPLVPILGEPVMGYALKLLSRHGLTEVAATLQYLPKAIRDTFGKGDAYDVRLRYLEETAPRGTAGSVRMTKGMTADTFVVLSGDGLTDCDLNEAMAFHRSKNAMATLVLKSVPIPLAYGVVITNSDGRIQRFVEKPDWSGVFSDQVNTGIYILEKEVLDLIPEEEPYDFGKQLFPKMVAQGLAVYGFLMDGYWCDIGDQEAYVQAQLDLLRGEVDLPITGHAQGFGWFHGDSLVEEGASLEGLCYIGKGAHIMKGAVLGQGAVIGPGAVVEEGAHIIRSCLWENSRVGRCAHVEGAVVCRGAVVRPGARMMEGCALGMGAILGAHALLHSGVKVWPEKEVGKELQATEHVVWGDVKCMRFDGDGIITVESPAKADQLAAAALHALGATSVALGYRDGGEALYHCLAGAFAARGAETLMLGPCFAPLLSRVQRTMRTPLSVLVEGQQVTFGGSKGMPLARDQRQKIENCAQRQEYPPAFTQSAAITPMHGMEELYLAQLCAGVDPAVFEKSGLQAAVFCDDPALRMLAVRLLHKAGLKKVRAQDTRDLMVKPWETGFLLDDAGTQAFALDSVGVPDEDRQQLLCYHLAAMEGALPLFVPSDAPRAVEALGPTRFSAQAHPESLKEEASALRQHDLIHDGLCRMLSVLQILAKEGLTLQNLWARLPKTYRVRADVPCSPGEKGRILRLLCESAREKELGEGVRIRHGSGSVWLTPFQDKSAFKVQTESFDAEFAGELCNHYASRISRLADHGAKKETISSPQNVQ